jgi:hypothetical protein
MSNRSSNVAFATNACIEALLYYQKSLAESKKVYNTLNAKVESFLSQFDNEE